MKPAPDSKGLLTVTGAVPLEVRMTDCGAAAAFICTLPKARFVALTVSAGTAAFNCSEKVCDTLPELAVSVAV